MDHFKDPKIFDDFEGIAGFSILDIFSVYWKIRISESCKEKETLVCQFGIFLFDVMPFSLMNAPSTIQRMMDIIFDHISFVLVYLYDVVVFSKS